MLHVAAHRMVIPFCLAVSLVSLGCSSGTTGTLGTESDGSVTPTPTPTSTSTSPTEPPKDRPDAAPSEQADADSPIDKTPHFELTLDGQAIAITNVTAKREPASGSRPERVNVSGSYEQQLRGGLTSSAVFTVFANVTEKGTDACGAGGREASYLFKDTDGAIRVIYTQLPGSSCTMKILSSAADGFVSGSATGVFGGAKTKSFTVAWGQPL